MLTDTQCRTAKPKEKLYRLNDFNGLYLEVKPNGKMNRRGNAHHIHHYDYCRI